MGSLTAVIFDNLCTWLCALLCGLLGFGFAYRKVLYEKTLWFLFLRFGAFFYYSPSCQRLEWNYIILCKLKLSKQLIDSVKKKHGNPFEYFRSILEPMFCIDLQACNSPTQNNALLWDSQDEFSIPLDGWICKISSLALRINPQNEALYSSESLSKGCSQESFPSVTSSLWFQLLKSKLQALDVLSCVKKLRLLVQVKGLELIIFKKLIGSSSVIPTQRRDSVFEHGAFYCLVLVFLKWILSSVQLTMRDFYWKLTHISLLQKNIFGPLARISSYLCANVYTWIEKAVVYLLILGPFDILSQVVSLEGICKEHVKIRVFLTSKTKSKASIACASNSPVKLGTVCIELSFEHLSFYFIRWFFKAEALPMPSFTKQRSSLRWFNVAYYRLKSLLKKTTQRFRKASFKFSLHELNFILKRCSGNISYIYQTQVFKKPLFLFDENAFDLKCVFSSSKLPLVLHQEKSFKNALPLSLSRRCSKSFLPLYCSSHMNTLTVNLYESVLYSSFFEDVFSVQNSSDDLDIKETPSCDNKVKSLFNTDPHGGNLKLLRVLCRLTTEFNSREAWFLDAFFEIKQITIKFGFDFNHNEANIFQNQVSELNALVLSLDQGMWKLLNPATHQSDILSSSHLESVLLFDVLSVKFCGCKETFGGFLKEDFGFQAKSLVWNLKTEFFKSHQTLLNSNPSEKIKLVLDAQLAVDYLKLVLSLDSLEKVLTYVLERANKFLLYRETLPKSCSPLKKNPDCQSNSEYCSHWSVIQKIFLPESFKFRMSFRLLKLQIQTWFLFEGLCDSIQISQERPLECYFSNELICKETNRVKPGNLEMVAEFCLVLLNDGPLLMSYKKHTEPSTLILFVEGFILDMSFSFLLKENHQNLSVNVYGKGLEVGSIFMAPLNAGLFNLFGQVLFLQQKLMRLSKTPFSQQKTYSSHVKKEKDAHFGPTLSIFLLLKIEHVCPSLKVSIKEIEVLLLGPRLSQDGSKQMSLYYIYCGGIIFLEFSKLKYFFLETHLQKSQPQDLPYKLVEFFVLNYLLVYKIYFEDSKINKLLQNLTNIQKIDNYLKQSEDSLFENSGIKERNLPSSSFIHYLWKKKTKELFQDVKISEFLTFPKLLGYYFTFSQEKALTSDLYFSSCSDLKHIKDPQSNALFSTFKELNLNDEFLIFEKLNFDVFYLVEMFDFLREALYYKNLGQQSQSRLRESKADWINLKDLPGTLSYLFSLLSKDQELSAPFVLKLGDVGVIKIFISKLQLRISMPFLSAYNTKHLYFPTKNFETNVKKRLLDTSIDIEYLELVLNGLDLYLISENSLEWKNLNWYLSVSKLICKIETLDKISPDMLKYLLYFHNEEYIESVLKSLPLFERIKQRNHIDSLISQLKSVYSTKSTSIQWKKEAKELVTIQNFECGNLVWFKSDEKAPHLIQGSNKSLHNTGKTWEKLCEWNENVKNILSGKKANWVMDFEKSISQQNAGKQKPPESFSFLNLFNNELKIKFLSRYKSQFFPQGKKDSQSNFMIEFNFSSQYGVFPPSFPLVLTKLHGVWDVSLVFKDILITIPYQFPLYKIIDALSYCIGKYPASYLNKLKRPEKEMFCSYNKNTQQDFELKYSSLPSIQESYSGLKNLSYLFFPSLCLLISKLNIHWEDDQGFENKLNRIYQVKSKEFILQNEARENFWWEFYSKEKAPASSEQSQSTLCEPCNKSSIPAKPGDWVKNSPWIQTSKHPEVLKLNQRLLKSYEAFLINESKLYQALIKKALKKSNSSDKSESSEFSALVRVTLSNLELVLVPPPCFVEQTHSDSFYAGDSVKSSTESLEGECQFIYSPSKELYSFILRLLYDSAFSMTSAKTCIGWIFDYELLNGSWIQSQVKDLKMIVRNEKKTPFVSLKGVQVEGLFLMTQKARDKFTVSPYFIYSGELYKPTPFLNALSNESKRNISLFIPGQSSSCIVHNLHALKLSVKSVVAYLSFTKSYPQVLDWARAHLYYLSRSNDKSLYFPPYVRSCFWPSQLSIVDKLKWTLRGTQSQLVVSKELWIVLQLDDSVPGFKGFPRTTTLKSGDALWIGTLGKLCMGMSYIPILDSKNSVQSCEASTQNPLILKLNTSPATPELFEDMFSFKHPFVKFYVLGNIFCLLETTFLPFLMKNLKSLHLASPDSGFESFASVQQSVDPIYNKNPGVFFNDWDKRFLLFECTEKTRLKKLDFYKNKILIFSWPAFQIEINFKLNIFQPKFNSDDFWNATILSEESLGVTLNKGLQDPRLDSNSIFNIEKIRVVSPSMAKKYNFKNYDCFKRLRSQAMLLEISNLFTSSNPAKTFVFLSYYQELEDFFNRFLAFLSNYKPRLPRSGCLFSIPFSLKMLLIEKACSSSELAWDVFMRELYPKIPEAFLKGSDRSLNANFTFSMANRVMVCKNLLLFEAYSIPNPVNLLEEIKINIQMKAFCTRYLYFIDSLQFLNKPLLDFENEKSQDTNNPYVALMQIGQGLEALIIIKQNFGKWIAQFVELDIIKLTSRFLQPDPEWSPESSKESESRLSDVNSKNNNVLQGFLSRGNLNSFNIPGTLAKSFSSISQVVVFLINENPCFSNYWDIFNGKTLFKKKGMDVSSIYHKKILMNDTSHDWIVKRLEFLEKRKSQFCIQLSKTHADSQTFKFIKNDMEFTIEKYEFIKKYLDEQFFIKNSLLEENFSICENYFKKCSIYQNCIVSNFYLKWNVQIRNDVFRLLDLVYENFIIRKAKRKAALYEFFEAKKAKVYDTSSQSASTEPLSGDGNASEKTLLNINITKPKEFDGDMAEALLKKLFNNKLHAETYKEENMGSGMEGDLKTCDTIQAQGLETNVDIDQNIFEFMSLASNLNIRILKTQISLESPSKEIILEAYGCCNTPSQVSISDESDIGSHLEKTSAAVILIATNSTFEISEWSKNEDKSQTSNDKFGTLDSTSNNLTEQSNGNKITTTDTFTSRRIKQKQKTTSVFNVKNLATFLFEQAELLIIYKVNWEEKKSLFFSNLLGTDEPNTDEPQLVHELFLFEWPPCVFFKSISNEDLGFEHIMEIGQLFIKYETRSPSFPFSLNQHHLNGSINANSGLSESFNILGSKSDVLLYANRLNVELPKIVKLKTLSSTYCSLFDIIGELLVYSDPHRKKKHQTLKELLLAWQSNNLKSKILENYNGLSFLNLQKDFISNLYLKTLHETTLLGDQQTKERIRNKTQEDLWWLELYLVNNFNRHALRPNDTKVFVEESIELSDKNKLPTDLLENTLIAIDEDNVQWFTLFEYIENLAKGIRVLNSWFKQATYSVLINDESADFIFKEQKDSEMYKEKRLIYNLWNQKYELYNKLTSELELHWRLLEKVVEINNGLPWNSSSKKSNSSLQNASLESSFTTVFATTNAKINIPYLSWDLLYQTHSNLCKNTTKAMGTSESKLEGKSEGLISNSIETQHAKLGSQKKIFMEALCKAVNVEFTIFEDSATETNLEIAEVQVINQLEDAYYKNFMAPLSSEPGVEDLSGSGPKSFGGAGLDADPHVRVFWKQLAPVGGISVLERLEINLRSTELKLYQDIDKKLIQFLFPQKAGVLSKTTPTTILVSKEPSSGMSSLGPGLSNHPIKTSVKTSENDSSDFTNELEAMKTRATSYRTFLNVLIPGSVHKISYKGKNLEGKNFEDLEGVKLKLSNVVYKNKTWNTLDLISAIRKDCIKMLLINTGTLVKEKIRGWMSKATSTGTSEHKGEENKKLLDSDISQDAGFEEISASTALLSKEEQAHSFMIELGPGGSSRRSSLKEDENSISEKHWTAHPNKAFSSSKENLALKDISDSSSVESNESSIKSQTLAEQQQHQEILKKRKLLGLN